MRVLITGATGFVGRHLIPVLEERGHSLTLAVRKATSKDRLPSEKVDGGRRTVVVGEIGRHTDWAEALVGADAVIHLAARAHVLDDTADDEEAFHEINARGTDRLVEKSIEARVNRFVLMSSIGAVTTASEVCVTLDTPCMPATAYGRSKLAAESALIERSAQSTMEWTILRPTLVYGPGNPGNMERLIVLVRRGWPLPLGAIRNRRSFTFVENLVDLTALVLSHPGAKNAVFLVSDGEDLSTPELISKIARHAGVRTPLVPVPSAMMRGIARAADGWTESTGGSLPFDTQILHRLESSLYVDIEPLRSRLDWAPPFGVDEGLRCMLATP